RTAGTTCTGSCACARTRACARRVVLIRRRDCRRSAADFTALEGRRGGLPGESRPGRLGGRQGRVAIRGATRPRRVLYDRVDDLRPRRTRQVVAHALHELQLRARDRARGRAAAGGTHERVGGAVDDQRWRPDLAQLGRAVARRDDRRELTPGTGGVVVALVAERRQLADLLGVTWKASRADGREEALEVR